LGKTGQEIGGNSFSAKEKGGVINSGKILVVPIKNTSPSFSLRGIRRGGVLIYSIILYRRGKA